MAYDPSVQDKELAKYGGTTQAYLRNVGTKPKCYTAEQPIRPPAIFTPPWKPQIVLLITAGTEENLRQDNLSPDKASNPGPF